MDFKLNSKHWDKYIARVDSSDFDRLDLSDGKDDNNITNVDLADNIINGIEKKLRLNLTKESEKVLEEQVSAMIKYGGVNKSEYRRIVEAIVVQGVFAR